MKEADLKRYLIELAVEGFELADAGDAFALLDEHLESLGSLDPELRDSLFYEAADAWITGGLLDPDQLTRLAMRLESEDFLFKGIGPIEGNDVFRRTFSLLVLDSIVRRSNAAGLPDVHLPESIAAAMERYVREERDLRGYVIPYGWAHAPAHGADVLRSLMAAPMREGWSSRILAMVQELLLKSGSVYAHQEDRRFARVLLAHVRCYGNRASELVEWTDGLLKACPAAFADAEAYARRTNLLDLLRALYFYLHREPGQERLADWVESHVRVLMRID
jgi:hypothetical protein